ncbi:unnamed protein product [Nippostrongylus brasiliensis]|uniref:Transmembrane protein 120 homolog (inferred by orthology to a D. melanogaster protein) n=1 Tax=Nippostrongylus brasiliensis TaxID=27835 RepID=A0A0N4YZN2_NIPBR|nr:unnamed protein product [Nippostrongylus brasiliensis]
MILQTLKLISSEGFATWMFQGLTFLLPFLVVAYVLELYNAYTLYSLWTTQECVWQGNIHGVAVTERVQPAQAAALILVLKLLNQRNVCCEQEELRVECLNKEDYNGKECKTPRLNVNLNSSSQIAPVFCTI